MMVVSSERVLKKLAENARAQRLQLDLTQEGLAERSGVPLATLRKFEQKGGISLEAFLKLHMVLGNLENILKASQPSHETFSSIDAVLAANTTETRKRGRRK